MSTYCSRKWAEELSAPAVEEGELPQGLTMGDLTDSHQMSVDPQQSTEVFAPEHPGDQNMRAYSPHTVPVWVQSPIGMAGAAKSGHNLGSASDESDHVSPDEGDTENEDGSFTIQASEVGRLHEECPDLINLKDNAAKWSSLGIHAALLAVRSTRELSTILDLKTGQGLWEGQNPRHHRFAGGRH
ncbi:hypothetical protein M422DRAFT_261399 [Sphaerobolus stellatus SS14]|uniref:Uncharacterized protein n=1 Tax=Sphaerobolus stellatus (strain SS14) TaxID=990650 RepID=A0A0C9V3D6_SPHS4|nr:hypothetical protein M422DRAFT_261399 [Sphaerobolus stellatus SS14]